MAAVKALAKLVKNYGPSMGRVIHDVAEETGIAASKVASMIRGSGPLKSKFDFENIFYHATPIKTLSRKAASRGGDPLEGLKRGVERGLVREPKTMEQLVAPFEELIPSGHGKLGPGSYFSRNPFWSLEMAVRKSDPRMASVFNPRRRNEPSIIPYVLKQGWKDRFISKEALDDVVGAKKNAIEDYLLAQYHNIGKSTNPKLYEKIIKSASKGGEFLRPGWNKYGGPPVSTVRVPPALLDMTWRKKRALRAVFKDIVPRNERKELIKKYKLWLKNPRPDPSFSSWSVEPDIMGFAREAARKSLAKEGKIGIYQPAGPWPWKHEEHLIFPGLEKEWVRHPLARFQNEIGGTFASLLPLISLLRGKREE